MRVFLGVALCLSVFLVANSSAQTILPPANLGTIPLDHDRFLQFPESDRTDTNSSATAYYEAVDPSGSRATLDDWKTANGFIEPLPDTTAGLAALGIHHALYRNATDLGFVRNVYMRVKPNGDIIALLENFPGFERTLNFSFDEAADACSTPFDPQLPAEQRCTSGGINAFENRDLSGMLASVVMEYSAVTPGGPKFTQFYGYGNDGTRVNALDLTGRGKAEFFPGLCAVCHGGNPGGVDAAGNFVPPDPAFPGASEGNFGGGFLPWDPDLYEYHDPFGAGDEIGSGLYSRANQMASFKELSRLVLDTNPTPATRQLVEGWYGGAELPGTFDGLFVPPGWDSVTEPERATQYKTVIAPYCRACHIQRALPESFTNFNAPHTALDFNEFDDLSDLENQVARTVFSRTTMPLALVTYDKFWSDPAAVIGFIALVESLSDSNYIDIIPIPVVPNAMGNPVAQMPGVPVADPGSYVEQVILRAFELDGAKSLSADAYMWTVTPSAGVTISDPTAEKPTFLASFPGVYDVTLVVTDSDAVDSAPASTTINVVESALASRVTFESAIRDSSGNKRCRNCHSLPAPAGFEDFTLYKGAILQMVELNRYASVEGKFVSRALTKSTGAVADYRVKDGIHGGGTIIGEGDEYYATFKAWIEDGECERGHCERISVTNEDTALVIDPLSTFIDKTLLVDLGGPSPAHGSLSLTLDGKLLYTPSPGFSGVDELAYLVTDPATGSRGLVSEKVFVFPDLGIIPPNLNKTFSRQYSIPVPYSGSVFEFEKVNTDGDDLPNFVDDFPNDPLISRDNDGDGFPDDFNLNVSAEEISASGIVVDQDDDNDGVVDAIDDLPFDPSVSVYVDSDRDGVRDALDSFPFDMLGTTFEDFESGDLMGLPWSTTGNRNWIVVPRANTPTRSKSPFLPLAETFSAQAPHLDTYDETATLSVNLTVPAGHVSFWYLVSAQYAVYQSGESLEFSIDGVTYTNSSDSFDSMLAPTNDWTRANFPVTSGNHTFAWTFSTGHDGSGGFDTAWLDAIEFSGPLDSDMDGASEPLDNCPLVTNSDQANADLDGPGNACDAGDFDGDGIADAQEVALGSDPSADDTDGDGVSDLADDFPLDASASSDSDGDGSPDSMVPGVTSSSSPQLTLDLEPGNARGGLDRDGDGVHDAAIYRVAGTGVSGFSGDGGPALQAQVGESSGISVGPDGAVYIAENNRIRRIDPVTDLITTIAGNGLLVVDGDGGLATVAGIGSVRSVVVASSGDLFLSERFPSDCRIRRVDAVTGLISTFAGTGICGFSGDGGPASAADLSISSRLTIHASGDLYFGGANRIRRIDGVTGTIDTIAGNGQVGSSPDGALASQSPIETYGPLAVDGAGNLYLYEYGRIRRVDAGSNVISTIAGSTNDEEFGYSGDGILATSALVRAAGLVVDAEGNTYYSHNDRVRRIDASSGIVSTVAGSGVHGLSGDGGPAPIAALSSPTSLAMDAAGDLLLAESGVVRQITLSAPTDQFPNDPAASEDSDGDGFPDRFNINATPAQIAASNLQIDSFPADPTAAVDDDGDGAPDYRLLFDGAPIPTPEPATGIVLPLATLMLLHAALRRGALRRRPPSGAL